MKQFDKHADAYHRIRDRVTYPESVYLTIATRAKSREAALDIGCGNGVSTVRLRPYFDYVEGCDLSPNLIAKAQSTHSGFVFSVSPAETYQSARRFDAVTSATSFYWMDRDKVLVKLRQLLKPGGVFCAYKYDFPIVYGPLRDFIENELATKWCKFRDKRLTRYDDSLERLAACSWMSSTERLVFPNIIDLSPRGSMPFRVDRNTFIRPLRRH
jgi:SAM-dependent methyltransferase